MKALDLLVELKRTRDFDGNIEYLLDEAIAELEALREDYKILCEDLIDEKKTKTYLLESSKKRIKELEELQSRSCKGCKHYIFESIEKYKEAMTKKTRGCCFICSRNYRDAWEAKR